MAAAVVVFLAAGALVEYWWLGLAVAVSAHTFFRRPTFVRFACVIAAVGALALINRNHWALLSLAVVGASSFWNLLQVPRLKGAFYAYYPAHLALLWAVQAALPGLKP